ncbi:hypothetical protein DY218_11235 [Streptomyces triticagri]|uniref:Carrier domain-containing protein n=1 Tax=Streptomyces triticagri TaxID=2293568 RepID=A0A372M868_9ACTN|nr:phosphopantetheine-binding protein [Streptomyces triticagri]RFU86633.1 hypothetical protein DY218_11235 [Streptomyces triticagri]
MAGNSTVEGVVAAEWCSMLGLVTPSLEGNFFDLGGNSLLAVTLVERIESRLGVELSLEDFFLDGRLSVLLDLARSEVR